MDYEKDVFNVSSPSKETIEEKVKETKKSIGELIPIPSQIKREIRLVFLLSSLESIRVELI